VLLHVVLWPPRLVVRRVSLVVDPSTVEPLALVEETLVELGSFSADSTVRQSESDLLTNITFLIPLQALELIRPTPGDVPLL
jgi:hypothetical protein